jgi:hypothetical protein
MKKVVMKRDADPSVWVRGRFYREGAIIILPVHVDEDIVDTLNALAKQRGVTPSELGNALLRKALAEPGFNNSLGAGSP